MKMTHMIVEIESIPYKYDIKNPKSQTDRKIACLSYDYIN